MQVMESKNYKHSSQSQVTFSELMLPSHSNFGGKIHGGYILSLMDQIAFACASKHSGQYCVTASVGSVDFLNPIEIGELVTMHASINHVGSSSMVVGIRVVSENIQTGIKKHCNSSYFTMVAKSGDGQSAVRVPGLLLTSATDVRRFIEAIKRKEQKQTNILVSNDGVYDPTPHLNELSGYNVQVELE